MVDPQAGWVTIIEIETGVSTGIYTALEGNLVAKLSISQNNIDVTDKDSNGWDEFVAGSSNAKLTLDNNYEEGGAMQADLLTMILSKQKRSIRFCPFGASSKKQYTCFALAESVDIDSPNKDQLSMPVTLQLTGQPVESVRP